MKNKIIDYSELEKPVRDIEKIIEEYDMEEKTLIMKIMLQRINKKKQQEQINDNMQNIKLGGLIKKFMKGGE